MKNYQKEILDHVIQLKEGVAGINEHLKTLNGKVAKNVLDIEEVRKSQESHCKDDITLHRLVDEKMSQLDKSQALLALKVGAIIGVVIFVVQFLLNRII